ncbi:MAG TPA: hypothetical protein VNG12_07710 [Acidimicrobiales bacterium]|nr:hypothetical protein [Acidimicrobiales bacterium]
MTSGSKSKAQRRQETQRRAAERRAAERRAQRVRIASRGSIVALLVGAVVLIVLLTTGGGTPQTPPSQKNPHLALQAIPASLHLTTPPTEGLSSEQIPIPGTPALATLVNAASGQTVDGIQCQNGEQSVTHVHTHLTIFVNGKPVTVPYAIGIPGFQAQGTPNGPFVTSGSCFYWLHTHAADGIIHIESPSLSQTFALGQFFDEWGIPLSTTQVGPAKGKVTVFFASPGKKAAIYTGDPRNLPLGYHYQIQLDVGTPVVAPLNVTKWGSL